jgi:DNA-binding transcriptional MerR regulator
MIRIGDFSKLSRVSVKALRYYDEMGILKPIHVDPWTGYRYYECHQLPRLNRILAFKDLGFSLEEIGRLLTENPPPDQLARILRLRQKEARERIQDETERLERVEARLRLIEQEASMSKYDVVIKRVEPLKVVSVRGIVPTPPQQGSLWEELGRHLAAFKVRTVDPCLTLYHDDEYKERDWDVEVCQTIVGELKETDRVKVRTLPLVEAMACAVHHGPFASIGEAYDAIMKWIDANGYRICGPAREVYLREATHGKAGDGVNVSQLDPETITEVQFPVQKVA